MGKKKKPKSQPKPNPEQKEVALLVVTAGEKSKSLRMKAEPAHTGLHASNTHKRYLLYCSVQIW